MAWLLAGQRTGIKVNVKLSTNSIDAIMRFGVSTSKQGRRSPNFQLFGKWWVLTEAGITIPGR